MIGNTVYTSSFKTREVGRDRRPHPPKTFELDQAGYTPVVSDGHRLFLIGYFELIGLEPKRAERHQVSTKRPPGSGRGAWAVGGGERRGDQRASLGRVDDVVELEQRRGVERPRVLLGHRGQVADALLALGLVGDRLELLAHRRAGPRPRAPSGRGGPRARRRSAAARAGCRRPSPGRRARSRGAGSPRSAAPALPPRRRAGARRGAPARSPRRPGRP